MVHDVFLTDKREKKISLIHFNTSWRLFKEKYDLNVCTFEKIEIVGLLLLCLLWVFFYFRFIHFYPRPHKVDIVPC